MNSSASPGPQSPNGKDPIPPAAGSPPHPSPETKPAAGATPVSRAPLNLGGPAAAAPAAPASPASAVAPRPTAAAPAAATAAVPTAAPRPVAARPAAAANGSDRITGCKTFFTKLHPGAIDFLDEQINQWLKDNPAVVIKMTNTSVGEVQGKKTEANILLTVWYHGQATKGISHMG
jgi:hypothetical protein